MPQGIPGLLSRQEAFRPKRLYYLITFTRDGHYATGTNVLLAHD
jgi:hypothetical protein